MVESFQFGDRFFRQICGQAALAGTPGRLPAAGLSFRNNYFAACFFKQAQGGESDRRSHQVDQTGDVES